MTPPPPDTGNGKPDTGGAPNPGGTDNGGTDNGGTDNGGTDNGGGGYTGGGSYGGGEYTGGSGTYGGGSYAGGSWNGDAVAQVSEVPQGSVDTGGGSPDGLTDDMVLLAAGSVVVGSALVGVFVTRRRSSGLHGDAEGR
ncbi:hypothetical protein ACFQ0O_09855 [Saccharopolyspora spinosporotrichia]|nr:hypothetical protein N599_21905 [Saccharopolyspora erythraea D]